MKFDKENILLNVNVKDKKDLFAYIARYAKKKRIIDDEQLLIKAFTNRESEVSTGLQNYSIQLSGRLLMTNRSKIFLHY